jgi:hypothetical protein
MNNTPEPAVAHTEHDELNAIPWIDMQGKREFSRQLGLTLHEYDLSFPDTGKQKIPGSDNP